MATRLFVGKLPYATTDAELEELFAKVGQVVSAKVITDRYSGQSKGFGFVEMGSQEDADNAIKSLDGSEVDGRTIVVNEARPMEDRGDRGGDRRGGDRRGGFQPRFNRDRR